MVIDHLHGRHEMPENIRPVRRLWVMTLLGDAASVTSTYVCSSAAKRLSTRRAAAMAKFVLAMWVFCVFSVSTRDRFTRA